MALASLARLIAIDYASLWWDPNESGWGVGLTQQFGAIFVAIFTYEVTGKPIR